MLMNVFGLYLQAVSFISTKLCMGDFEDLEDLVCPVALAEIKKNLENFNVAQRQLLAVEPDDIFFSFPFEIGIIIPDEQSQTSKLGILLKGTCFAVLL